MFEEPMLETDSGAMRVEAAGSVGSRAWPPLSSASVSAKVALPLPLDDDKDELPERAVEGPEEPDEAEFDRLAGKTISAGSEANPPGENAGTRSSWH